MKCISIFKCKPQIEIIDKSHCNLEDVPNFQSYSRSLEELFLDANKLTLLNENVFKLTKLRRFSFSDNGVLDIPPDIAKLVNLIELDCSRNRIQIIPEQIKFLRGLQVCDFSGNDIEYLPNGLVQLKNLTLLTLNYCLIKDLPEDIGLLKNLESLELRENEIETLPSSITGLENLKKLDLGRNLISRLPEDIGRLENLEYLLLDANRLSTLPPKIGQLEKLQCLDVSKQDPGFRHLPEEVGGLICLTDLHLSENHLTSLPDGIGLLRNLTIMKADANMLSDLNPTIGGCLSLQELVLTSNEISKLPCSIGNLADLRSLNVDDNMLNELPQEIGNLKKLGILSLRDNLLTHLPNEFGELDSLKVVDLSSNQLEYLPIDIAVLNLNALWLSKNQAQPLPKLQIDELANGTRVLTCYLLPQISETGPTKEQQFDDSVREERPAAVSFDTAVIDDSENLFNDVNFVRHDTPHPRELRARHLKLLNGGQMDQQDPNARQDPNDQQLKGHDNEGFNMNVTNQTDNDGFNMNAINQANNDNFNINATNHADNNNSHPIQPPYDYRYESNGLPEVQTQPSNSCQVIDFIVRRSKHHRPGLGLSIAGGKDTPPFKDDDEGIFVSKITQGGPAEAAGVHVGDKILAVNNNNFYEGITHHEAVEVFRSLKSDCAEFRMRVSRDPSSDVQDQVIQNQIIHTTLVKDYKHDLGIELESREENDNFSRKSSGSSNIVIAEILPNSVASRDGKLQVEDILLSINGTDVTGIDLHRVKTMLNGTDRFIRIVVSRGDLHDPIRAALRNVPVKPLLGGWFSSTSNVTNRPSLIESYERPSFGSVTNIQNNNSNISKKNESNNEILSAEHTDEGLEIPDDQAKRAAWRKERLKSIDDDVEMAKILAELHRRRNEDRN